MKLSKFLLFLCLLWGHFNGFGQDISNKGTDFWLGYGYHQSMTTGNTQDMVLYFTSDKDAVVTVSIPKLAGNYLKTYNIKANKVTISDTIPKSGVTDARNNVIGLSDKGIHVTSTVPVVAYAHIYNQSVSGASLLFPTNTLGKDYYSINFTQSGNFANANSFFFVVATEDNTTVEITPADSNLNALPIGLPFKITLNQGQIYTVMGTTRTAAVNGTFLGSDLTGSRIKTVSSNGSEGCKKIAVFSGSGRLSIGGTANLTSDNLFAQAFPSVAWGKKYLTAPTGSQPNNFYRVCVTDPTTVVKLNGTIIPKAQLVNGFYYQFKNGNAGGSNPPIPNIIESDIPILVAQYCTSQGQEGNSGLTPFGDPEMIFLSPIEQTINNITLYSASKFLILQSYINVIIKKGGIATFQLDGNSKASSFLTHPQDTTYSYAILTVDSGSHALYSDTGFNAIAYGFGLAESYGYNAGTNLRDFSPVAIFQNEYARIDSAATCANAPLRFSVPLTFKPTSLTWNFSAAPNISPNAIIGPINNPVADSTPTKNGQTLNYYSTKSIVTFTKINTTALRDTIKLYTTSSTPDGCGSFAQVYSFPVTVKEAPIGNFTFIHSGCLTDSVTLTDQSSGANGILSRWLWDFSDGTFSDLKTATITPKLYNSAGTGSYDIKLKAISEIGCAAAEVVKNIKISTKPIATFTVPPVACVNDLITFTNSSNIQVGTIIKWVWDLDNGVGADTLFTNISKTNKYTVYGSKDVKLFVESSTGCKSDTFRISPQFKVNPYPEIGFTIPEICLSDASASFTDTTKISDGSLAQLSYLWNFNAGTPAVVPAPSTLTSILKNPFIKYNKAADYQVSLKVTSKDGCVATLVQPFTVNGSNPTPIFEILKPNGLCGNDSVRIINKSIVDFGNVTRLEIYWDFVGAPSIKVADENPYIGKTYAFKYPDFQTPATVSYSIRLVAFSGNVASCQKGLTQTITINSSPKVSFSTMPGICNEVSSRQITQAIFDARVSGTFVYSGNGVNSTGIYNAQLAGVGNYPIKYLYTSDKGCMDSASRNITIWPTPIAKWSVSGIFCQQKNILFTDSSESLLNNITQRIWNYNDGSADSIITGSGSYIRQYKNAKIFNTSLQVITDSGCRSAFNIQPININNSPKPAFTLPVICLPDGNALFTNQSTIDDGSEALFSYLWTFNDPTDPSSSTLKEPIHKYSAVGPYTVKLRISSKDGCVDSLTKVLSTVYAQPKGNFNTSPDNVCINNTISFTDIGDTKGGTAVSWSWDLGNGITSTLQNPQRLFADSGKTNISYSFVNSLGCVSDTFSKQVFIYPFPKLVIGPTIKVLDGGVATIKPQFSYGAGLKYLWKPSLYLNSDTLPSPTSTPLANITYQLVLTGLGGCSVSDTISIQLLKLPEIPNAFSPNGDGINDSWRINYLESYPGAVIEVFNRYGQIVYHSIGYDTYWDGTYNGKTLPIGTYYYIINPKNGRNIISGSVTIIK